MNNKVKASGNVDSMINYSNLTEYCYGFMFASCPGLTLPPLLPSTQLADECYNNMFGYCSSLEVAPELPATTLCNQCYYNMFNNCTSLMAIPPLPKVDHFAQSCFGHMFLLCSQLHISEDVPGEYGALLLDLTNVSTLPEGATE
ncbi:MAG: hypothetical protein MJ195_01480 [Mycoplasmoidaceae bacterium]|nr:hypothetical protein [Mycoplasmoidaceae bacterium]